MTARLYALPLILALAAPATALPIQLPDKAEISRLAAAYPVALADLPSATIAAFVAQEDRFFWERARAGKDSTLTATAVRLLVEDTPTTWAQASPLEKEDAVEALTLAATPEVILTIYLNLIPLGPEATGLTEAADRYFDKAPKALTPAEAAWLAAVAGSPEIALKPANRDRTKSQRDYILRQIQKAGAMTDAALEEQLRQPMPDLSR
ncbi:transglycosylase domain-containing protein [Pseudooceanicola sp.]|uniref:transglycosylase domain-containing protein n=1 Tax=Pseudooceanicola sp. TaxID=1914328 RepID=UPI0035C70674